MFWAGSTGNSDSELLPLNGRDTMTRVSDPSLARSGYTMTRVSTRTGPGPGSPGLSLGGYRQAGPGPGPASDRQTPAHWDSDFGDAAHGDCGPSRTESRVPPGSRDQPTKPRRGASRFSNRRAQWRWCRAAVTLAR